MADLYIEDFPDELYRAIEELADREGRSFDEQVIRLLQEALATYQAHSEPGRIER